MNTPPQMAELAAMRPAPPGLFARGPSERRVLAILKAAGEMPASEIARQAGLSAQSASVITRALAADGLICKGEPTRGKVGKPLTPFRLNPEGAFSVGLRIGRRSAEMVLIDLAGAVRGDVRTAYPYPTPDRIVSFARDNLAALTQTLAAQARSRIAGFGIGMPFEMWNWLELESTPQAEMDAWKHTDLAQSFAEFTDLPVMVANDSSMACSGEHAFGSGAGQTDFVYFYVGSLVGGGVVLNDRVYLGPTGNAGAFGSLPVVDADGTWRQLNTQASLIQLETALEARWPGDSKTRLRAEVWAGFDDLLDQWIDRTAESLAYAALSAVVAFDLPQIILDCSAPASVRSELARRLTVCMQSADTRGITVPRVTEGKFGPFAGALGAAYEPLSKRLLTE